MKAGENMKHRLLICIILAAIACTSCTLRNAEGNNKTVPNDISSAPEETEEPTSSLAQDDSVSALEACQSVLENKSTMYIAETEEMYLSEYIQNSGFSIKKYSVIDLNGDSEQEMVLLLDYGSYTDYGSLILHSENDKVYAYTLWYRAFNSLKEDGTFHFSSGASDNGTGNLDFSGGTYTVDKIAYCESVYDKSGGIRYFIAEKSVSKEEFDAHYAEQSEKPDAVWREFTGDYGG